MKTIQNQLLLLASLLLLTSTTARAAGSPGFHDVARDASGNVKYMSQADAIQYCTNQGARLPNARELAQLSMSFGSKGIVNIDDCPGGGPCYKVYLYVNIDGTKDEFWFDYSGYQRPDGSMGLDRFWSSSVDNYYPYLAYFLDGYDGTIGIGNQGSENAVLCLGG